MSQKETNRQTLYRHVAPDGTPRKDGLKVIEAGQARHRTERNSERHGVPRFSVHLLLGPLKTETFGNGVGLLHLNRFFRTFGADKKRKSPAINNL
jgi:hypothetical protein